MDLINSIPQNIEVDRFVSNSFDVVDRIHFILRKKGYTQRDLAKILNKSESEISKWMSGMYNFTLRTIASIEVKLGENILSIIEPKAACEPDYVYFRNEMISRFGSYNVDCPECLPSDYSFYEESTTKYTKLHFISN